MVTQLKTVPQLAIVTAKLIVQSMARSWQLISLGRRCEGDADPRSNPGEYIKSGLPRCARNDEHKTNRWTNKHSAQFQTIILLTALLCAGPAHATITDLADMLQNLRKLLGPLMTLLLIISYVAGIIMLIKGFSALRSFGSQASKPGEMTGPLIYIIVGTVLVYLPSTTDIVTHTIFGNDSGSVINSGTIDLSALGKASDKLLSYAPVAIEGQWADLFDTIILYVQFIGFLAFIRGWFIVSHAGQPGSQPGSISKGATHIIGGIIAVNFLPMVEILHNTLFGGS